MSMVFRVTRQFPRGSEFDLAQFDEQEDAKLFCCMKAEKDGLLNVDTVYRLYKRSVLVGTFKSKEQNSEQVVSSSGSSSAVSKSSSSSSQTFNPNPFQTTLRPGGMPSNWSSKKKENINKEDDVKK